LCVVCSDSDDDSIETILIIVTIIPL